MAEDNRQKKYAPEDYLAKDRLFRGFKKADFSDFKINRGKTEENSMGGMGGPGGGPGGPGGGGPPPGGGPGGSPPPGGGPGGSGGGRGGKDSNSSEPIDIWAKVTLAQSPTAATTR